MTKFVTVFFASMALALAAAGCSAADPITNHFTCKDVCQSYADCFDSKYDVDGCKDKCESKASDSDNQQSNLDQCHDCIDNKSCVADVASCSGSCSNFVP